MVQLFFAQPLAGIPDEQRCCTVAGCEFDAETPSRRGVMNGVAEQILNQFADEPSVAQYPAFGAVEFKVQVFCGSK